MKTATKLFTEEEKERIRGAVAREEARSSGEIVPMVVDRSGHYMEFVLTGAILFTFLVAVVVTFFWHRATAPQILLVEFSIFWVSFSLIRRIRPIWSWLIPDSLKDQAVRRRAEEAFYEHRLHETRDKTGILIFLSLLEHRVELLADVGIQRRVPQERWDRLVSEIALQVKAGRSFEALTNAIESCGQLLTEHFPKTPSDFDELPDHLRIEEKER
ncbi:MAG: TPM domain-containing protein [Candidatus Manganitrophaceae bacterium]